MTAIFEHLKPGYKWDKEEDEQGIEINDPLSQALEQFAKSHRLGNVVNGALFTHASVRGGQT